MLPVISDVVSQPATWAILLAGGLGSAIDLKTRRIPNLVTITTAAAGLIVGAAQGGGGGFGTALLGLGVGLAVFFPIFALGAMGAGDVKLLAAFGAWLGPVGALWAALYAAIIGGGLAVPLALWHGYLTTALRNVWFMLTFWRTAGLQPVPNLTLETSRGPKMAYSVPIFAGAVCSLLWR